MKIVLFLIFFLVMRAKIVSILYYSSVGILWALFTLISLSFSEELGVIFPFIGVLGYIVWTYNLYENFTSSMTKKDAIFLARKYNLEEEVRQELEAGLSPEEALEEWDIL